MSLYDKADAIDAGATGSDKTPPHPKGDHEFAVLSISEFRPPLDSSILYWKCKTVTLSGPHKGTIATYMEQLEGGRYPSYNAEALARVKKFTGALFGMSDIAQINAAVKGQEIRGLFAQDGKVARGATFAASIEHKVTGAGKTIAKYDVRPAKGATVGQLNVVDVSAIAAAADAAEQKFSQVPAEQTQTKAVAPAPVAPPAAPPAAPAAIFPPPGWKTHPTAPDAYYKDGMASCINGAELRTLAATGRA